MANGTAALKILAPEPAPALPPEHPSKDTLADPSIETEIGRVAASVACALCYATDEKMNGGTVSSATRAAGGARIERLFRMQEAFVGDFTAVVRREGAKALRESLEGHPPAAVEFMVGWALDSALAALDRVTASERALH